MVMGTPARGQGKMKVDKRVSSAQKFRTNSRSKVMASTDGFQHFKSRGDEFDENEHEHEQSNFN